MGEIFMIKISLIFFYALSYHANIKTKGDLAMDYNKKASKWREALKGGSEIECIFVRNGKAMYLNRKERIQPDFVYYCMMEHEKRIMEQTWHINDAEKESISEAFLIKEKKKMIFIHEEKAYGFGFGENEKNRSIILYLRRDSGAMLIWAGTDDKQLNTMFEVNMVNPESLDSLIDFVKRKDIENSIHKMKESEDFMNELMGS